MTTQFFGTRELFIWNQQTKRRQILSCDLHGLCFQFLCKQDPEGAFAYADWGNICPQWQMDVAGSIVWSILTGGKAFSMDNGLVPLPIVFVSIGGEAPVKILGIQYIYK